MKKDVIITKNDYSINRESTKIRSKSKKKSLKPTKFQYHNSRPKNKEIYYLLTINVKLHKK